MVDSSQNIGRSVGKKQNFIEINDQRYDAQTGQLLSSAKDVQANTNAIAKSVHHNQPDHRPKKNAAPSRQTNHHHKATSQPIHDIQRPIHPVKPHAPQTAVTLMRKAVSKPSTAPKRHLRAHHPAAQGQPPVRPAVIPKIPAAAVDISRLKHAQRTPQSKKVFRFKDTPRPVLELPVAPGSTSSRPLRQTSANETSPSQPKTTRDVLQIALKQADSHAAVPRPPRRKLRINGLTGVIAGVVILMGFILVQSIPSIQVRVASAKAGFNAGLPGYRPAGFSLGDLSYSAGVVGLNFRSNSDNRSYSVTEKQSNWDSAGLRDTFVSPKGDYQVVQAAGRTVYLYGANNATWINNGVWYQVHSDGVLSNRQLVSIANSL